KRRIAAVEPEVRPADAGDDNADDRVGGLDDQRITAITGRDRAGLVEDRRTHSHYLHLRRRRVKTLRRTQVRRRGARRTNLNRSAWSHAGSLDVDGRRVAASGKSWRPPASVGTSVHA